MAEKVEEISTAKWFYQQKQMMGLETPQKAAFTCIRELLENSLDACERAKIPPEISISVREKGNSYEIAVVDNGTGVLPEYIPTAFGKMLTSSKFKNRQDRGLFGIAGKSIILLGQLYSGKPFNVVSATKGSKVIHKVKMKLNMEKDEPDILEEKKVLNRKKWNGTSIKIYISSLNFDFDKALYDLQNYLKLNQIVCPYADITFGYNDETYEYEPRTEKMPEPAQETPFHPQGLDRPTLDYLISTTRAKNMVTFLSTLNRVGEVTAKQFLKFANIPNSDPNKLKDRNHLIRKMKEFDKWIAPSTECLSLVGEENFKVGVGAMFPVQFITYASRIGVYQGVPFGVEVCVSVGGKPKSLKGEKRSPVEYLYLYRFTNKIPMIAQYKSCQIWKACEDINWHYYGIDPSQIPIHIFVHICSTSKGSLFKTLDKGSIVADIPEVKKSIYLTLRDAVKKLGKYVKGRKREAYESKRKVIFALYIPLISEHVAFMTQKDKEEIQKLIGGVF